MQTAIVLSAAKFFVAISFAVGVSALAGLAVAQDAAKADVPSAAATKQSDASSDRHKSRAERRAEAAPKTEAVAKSETLTQFPKADSAAVASTAPAQPKIECRTQPVTGSRLGKRICATPEQWAQADEAAAEVIRQMRSENSKSTMVSPSGPFSSGGVP